MVVQRTMTDPADLERLQKYYVSECKKMGLSSDDPACQKALQDAIDLWDNGEVTLAETSVGSALVMLAVSGGHSSVGRGVTAAATKDEALDTNRAQQQRFRKLIADGAGSAADRRVGGPLEEHVHMDPEREGRDHGSRRHARPRHGATGRG